MKRMLFTNPNHLDFTEGQNTFRRGTKWSEELKIGDTIELALTKDGTETDVGTAKVVGIVVGKLAGLLGRHAWSNHETFTMNRDGFAEDELYKILRSIYPETSVEDVYTVVYLDRTPS